MGGRGGSGGRGLTLNNDDLISKYQLKSKKWTDDDLDNLKYSLSFMEKHFGNMDSVVAAIKRREIGGEAGHYDLYEKTVYLSSSYTNREVILHELTHSISEKIAGEYKKLGFKSREDALAHIADEVRKSAGLPPYKWNRRKWAGRPEEHLSQSMELFANPQVKFKESTETLRVLKKYYKQLRRKK